jgi:Cytochrome c1
MKKLLPLLVLAALIPCAGAADTAPVPGQAWPFAKPFSTYDRATLQRGYQVYKEVCSACHSLNMVAFHDLAKSGGPAFSDGQMRALAASSKFAAPPNERGETLDATGNRLMRPGTPADHLPAPFPNEEAARVANNGAVPPDLSLIVKARKDGPDYVYAILTGFGESAPHGFSVPDGKFYNPYFPGRVITMPPPLAPDAVSFADGTPATVENEAKAVATFLAWAADPNLEERRHTGFQVIAFLLLLASLLGLTAWRLHRRENPKPAVEVSKTSSDDSPPEAS